MHAREDRVVGGAQPVPLVGYAPLRRRRCSRRCARSAAAPGRSRRRDDVSSRSSTPSWRASEMVFLTRPGAIGWSGPKSYLVSSSEKTSRPLICGRPAVDVVAVAGRRGQVTAAVPGRLHGADERRAYLVILELAYGGGGRAARRGHPLAQHRRDAHRSPAAAWLSRAWSAPPVRWPCPGAGRGGRRPRSSPRRRRTGTPAPSRRWPSPHPDSAPERSAPDRSRTRSSVTRSRCSWSLCEPGEMAAMPSSTWAGVLGITRTTATPSASADSMEAVSTPAASETTSWPGLIDVGDLGQQIAHVLRLDDQDHRVRVGRPPRCSPSSGCRTCAVSSTCRSGRRSVATIWSGCQPARSRPDSTVSPITPAPRMASIVHRRMTSRVRPTGPTTS